jgi:hypothetical protein
MVLFGEAPGQNPSAFGGGAVGWLRNREETSGIAKNSVWHLQSRQRHQRQGSGDGCFHNQPKQPRCFSPLQSNLGHESVLNEEGRISNSVKIARSARRGARRVYTASGRRSVKRGYSKRIRHRELLIPWMQGSTERSIRREEHRYRWPYCHGSFRIIYTRQCGHAGPEYRSGSTP